MVSELKVSFGIWRRSGEQQREEEHEFPAPPTVSSSDGGLLDSGNCLEPSHGVGETLCAS